MTDGYDQVVDDGSFGQQIRWLTNQAIAGSGYDAQKPALGTGRNSSDCAKFVHKPSRARGKVAIKAVWSDTWLVSTCLEQADPLISNTLS